MSYILDFNTAADLDTIGGKGRSLARLFRAGFPVPPGFNLAATAYRQFIADNHLRDKLLELTEPRLVEQAVSFDAQSREIAGLFAMGSLPGAVKTALGEAYAALGKDVPVAVRSSANAEDLPEASFAGQQETYLNVVGEGALLQAVRDCWASLWTARAMNYRHERGIPPESVAIAVVVQRMVPSDVSGILFTANPATGERSELIINASFGLGEAIVGGQVTPDTYIIDAGSLAAKETVIGPKDKKIVSRPGSGVMMEAVPEDRRDASSLTAGQQEALARIGLRIQALFDGVPQDIEWAVAGSEIWLLQSRPITNLLPQPVPAEPWEPPVPGMRLARRKYAEYMPNPLSPLFKELYFEGLLPEEGWAANNNYTINGYAYEGTGSDDKPVNGRELRAEKKTTPEEEKRLREEQEAATAKMAAPYFSDGNLRRWRDEFLPEYMATIEKWEKTESTELSDTELLEGIVELTTADATYLKRTLMPVSLMKAEDYRLQEFLAKHAPESGLTSCVFLTGFKSRSMQSQIDLFELAQQIQSDDELVNLVLTIPASRLMTALQRHGSGKAIAAAIETYIDNYGGQIYSLDFSDPLHGEDLTIIMQLLQNQVRNGTDLRSREKILHRRCLEVAAGLKEALSPARYSEFLFRLWVTRHFARHREELVSHAGAAWRVLKMLARELGSRLADAGTLADADDVFYLVRADLERAIEARREGRSLPELAESAGKARLLRQARKRLRPPEAIPAQDSQTSVIMMVSKANAADGNVLHGFAVSPGQVTGEASLIFSTEDFGNMKPGSILVCPMTTPAWTPLFSHAAALVTDIGGLLSHGSIVAREFGIPAVLGVGAATKRIKNDQEISEDGDQGTVTILKEV